MLQWFLILLEGYFCAAAVSFNTIQFLWDNDFKGYLRIDFSTSGINITRLGHPFLPHKCAI